MNEAWEFDMPNDAARRKKADATLRERWQQLGYDNLLQPERECIAIYWLVGDVSNGGFDQYFFNSSGDLALQAVSGLRAIKADEAHDVLVKALAVFPPGAYSTDRETRWQGMKDSEQQRIAFDEVTDAFYAITEDIYGKALEHLADMYSVDGTW